MLFISTLHLFTHSRNIQIWRQHFIDIYYWNEFSHLTHKILNGNYIHFELFVASEACSIFCKGSSFYYLKFEQHNHYYTKQHLARSVFFLSYCKYAFDYRKWNLNKLISVPQRCVFSYTKQRSTEYFYLKNNIDSCCKTQMKASNESNKIEVIYRFCGE